MKNQDAEEGTIKVHLLKGILYRDESPETWNDLLLYRGALLDWFIQIGLEIFIDETEGYAFLRQKAVYGAEEIPLEMPALISNRTLSYGLSLFCVLLHKKLVEHETHQSGSCVISKAEIVEMMKVFLADTKNEAKVVDEINAHINKTVLTLGFLRPLQGEADKYEIRRILKAFVNAQNLADFRTALLGVNVHETEKELVA